ncbi:MAG: MarR family transcriptional regulator [Rhizobiaceae bacterium]
MPDSNQTKNSDDAQQLGAVFGFFNEIGIINQLSSALFQKRLADGVTVAQFSVLNHLTRVKDGQTPLALTSAFQVPKTTMTHTLAGLEKRGLIEMKPNLEDGRSKLVWLTPAGEKFRQQSIAALIEDMNRLKAQLDLPQMLQAIPTLTKVRQVLDEDRD